MIRRTLRFTRTDTLCRYATLVRAYPACGGHQYLRVDVGRDDLDRRRQPAGGFGGADRDRIRFLAGRGRRAPDPRRTIARQTAQENLQLLEVMRLAEKARQVCGQRVGETFPLRRRRRGIQSVEIAVEAWLTAGAQPQIGRAHV